MNLLTIRINKNSLSIVRTIQFALLFLSALNFYAKCYYFLYISFLVFLISNKGIVLPTNCIFHLLVCIIMSLYNLKDGATSMLKCLTPFLLYVLGYNIMGQYAQVGVAVDNLKKIILTLSLGLFIHYMLNLVINFGSYNLSRNTTDIWTKEMMAATGQAVFAFLMIGVATSYIIVPNKTMERPIGLVFLLLIVFYDLILASRSMLFIIAIVFLAGFIFYLKAEQVHNKRIKTVILLLCVLCFFIIACSFNIGGIADYFNGSNLFERFNSMNIEDTRMHNKLIYLKNFFKYIFGGSHLQTRFGYAHDLLLDGYDEYGLIVFLLLLVMLITSILRLYRFIKKPYLDVSKRTIVICVYAAIYVSFFIEPILEGMFYLFVYWCMFDGMLSGMDSFEVEYNLNECTAY